MSKIFQCSWRLAALVFLFALLCGAQDMDPTPAQSLGWEPTLPVYYDVSAIAGDLPIAGYNAILSVLQRFAAGSPYAGCCNVVMAPSSAGPGGYTNWYFYVGALDVDAAVTSWRYEWFANPGGDYELAVNTASTTFDNSINGVLNPDIPIFNPDAPNYTEAVIETTTHEMGHTLGLADQGPIVDDLLCGGQAYQYSAMNMMCNIYDLDEITYNDSQGAVANNFTGINLDDPDMAALQAIQAQWATGYVGLNTFEIGSTAETADCGTYQAGGGYTCDDGDAAYCDDGSAALWCEDGTEPTCSSTNGNLDWDCDDGTLPNYCRDGTSPECDDDGGGGDGGGGGGGGCDYYDFQGDCCLDTGNGYDCFCDPSDPSCGNGPVELVENLPPAAPSPFSGHSQHGSGLAMLGLVMLPVSLRRRKARGEDAAVGTERG